MNSNFSNSNFGRILYVAIITLIVAATIFVIWYMTVGYKIGTYEADTRLGSVYIGGLTEEEVGPKLEQKINYWYNDDTILFELRYQGYSYEFDRNLFYFNVDSSVKTIKQGQVNELHVYYEGSYRDVVVDQISDQEFLENVYDNINLDKLIADILSDASLMKSYSIKNVEDYLVDESLTYQEIDRVNLVLPVNFEYSEMTDKITEQFPEGRIEVSPESLFDIIDTLGETMADEELSVLSSGMLDLIIDTNFLINEVHYDSSNPLSSTVTIDNYPMFGRNTVIAEIVDESFSFYNPNVSSYYFVVNDDQTISLEGVPFEYEINVTIEKDAIPHIYVGQLDSSGYQDGYDGIVVQVHREIVDVYDEVVSEDKVILFEFYPPVEEVGLPLED